MEFTIFDWWFNLQLYNSSRRGESNDLRCWRGKFLLFYIPFTMRQKMKLMTRNCPKKPNSTIISHSFDNKFTMSRRIHSQQRQMGSKEEGDSSAYFLIMARNSLEAEKTKIRLFIFNPVGKSLVNL